MTDLPVLPCPSFSWRFNLFLLLLLIQEHKIFIIFICFLLTSLQDAQVRPMLAQERVQLV